MFEIEVWHNLSRDKQGRYEGYDGYRAYHARHLVRVFRYTDAVTPADAPESACERAFAAFNAPPDALNAADRALAASYRETGLRSLSVGDVLVLRTGSHGRTAYACSSMGFTRLRFDPTAGRDGRPQ